MRPQPLAAPHSRALPPNPHAVWGPSPPDANPGPQSSFTLAKNEVLTLKAFGGTSPYFTDPNGDAMTISAPAPATGVGKLVMVDAAGGVVKFLPPYNKAGAASFALQAADVGELTSGPLGFTVTVGACVCLAHVRARGAWCCLHLL